MVCSVVDIEEALYFYYIGKGCAVCRNCRVSLMGNRPSINCGHCSDAKFEYWLEGYAERLSKGFETNQYEVDVVVKCDDFLSPPVRLIEVKDHSERPSSYELCREVCWHYKKARHLISALGSGRILFATNVQLPDRCTCGEEAVGISQIATIPADATTKINLYEVSAGLFFW